MRAFQEITERIRYVEGFEVLVSSDDLPPYPSAEYRFGRAANRVTTVGHWLSTRFRSAYPNFTANVVRPDGLPIGEDVPIGFARDAYRALNGGGWPYLRYGQSISYEYSGNVEHLILSLRKVLGEAGLEAAYDRSKFLFFPETFCVRGTIANVHLPVFESSELLSLLKALALPLKVEFSQKFGHESSNLFEAGFNQKYFGTDDLERVKSMTSRQR